MTDIAREMVPSTFETVENGVDDFKTAFDTLKELKSGGLKRVNKKFNEIDQIKSFKGVIGNAVEDLKTGNIYNKKREDKALGLDFDDFDEDGFDMDLDLGEDEEDGEEAPLDDSDEFEEEPAEIISSRINAASAEAIAETVAIQTEVLAKSIQGSAEVSASLSGAQLSASKNSGIVLGKGLQSINENISLLVEFNNQTMNAYVGSSLKYYEDTVGTLGKILESHASLLNASQAPPQSSKSDKITIEDLLSDGINFKNIQKLLTQNAKEFSESNMFISTAKMFWDEKDGIAAMAANPIGNLMKMGIKSAIPQFFKESLAQMDNSIKNFVPALFMKANRMRNRWDNPVLQMFGELFGANVTTKKEFSISDYNNGPTPFDGETKKSITEIIPSYLRKILAAITDSDELVYDHKVNKFKTFTDAREDLMGDIRRERLSPFSSDIHRMMKDASFIKFPDYESEKEFRTKLEDFFIKVADNEELLNIEGTVENGGSFFDKLSKKLKIEKYLKKKKKDDDDKNDEKPERDRTDLESLMASMSYDEQRLAKLMIDNLEKNKKIELFGAGVIRSRANARKYFEERENDPNKFLLNQIFHDPDLEKDKTKLTKKIMSGATAPDKHGHSTLSYLRNIQELLVKGIKVFNMNASGNAAPHLDKYELMMDKENKKAEEEKKKEEKIKPSFTPEAQDEARQKGEYKINDMSDLADVSDKELSNKMRETAKLNKEKENGTNKKSFIRSMIDKMLKGEAKDNFNKFADKMGSIFKKPIEILDGITKKIDNTLYSLLFGSPDDDDEGRSLINSIGGNIKKTFVGIKDWTISHIYEPLKESLFGKEGIISKIKESKFYDSAKSKFSSFKDYTFGLKDDQGFRQGGMFADTYNSFKDIFKGFSHQFTGKEYTDSKGTKTPATDNSVFGEIKKVTRTVTSSIKTKFFGEKDEDGNYKENTKGFITKSLDAIHDGFSNFSTALFGTKKFDERKTGKDYLEQFKAKLPKSLAWGTIGTGLGMFSGVGLLGGLFLPSGPFGMGILAASAGMLSQSEKFKNWMFGKKDEQTNERLGGVVKKSTQDFLKKNKIPVVAGAGIGAFKGLIGGAGFLPSLIVGGPIGGAVMGMASAMALKSKTFNNFLFGESDGNGNKLSEGIVNKFKKSFNFKIGDKDNKFGNMGAGAIGGAVLSKVVGQFGLLGGMMTMGGSPLFGALAGAAAGISLSSDKWRKAIFGEIDEETGKRRGGTAKIANWLSINVGRPLANKIEETQINMKEWFTIKIANPILKVFDPLIAELKFFTDTIKKMFKKLVNSTKNMIKTALKDYIGTPISNAIKKLIVNPIGKVVGGTLKAGGKLAAGTLALPFSALNMLGDKLENRHMRRGIKMYKQGLDEDFREARNARKYKNNQDEWRRQVQKRKGIMSDAEWEEYSNKYSNMKKPGRLKTFAKKYFDNDARVDAMYGENGAYYAERGERRNKIRSYIDTKMKGYADERKKLREKQEQDAMRAEYAKHYGYDNFSKNGEYKGWIYDDDVRFERGEDGTIKAMRDVPETKISMATDGIKSNTDIMVDILSDIKDSVNRNNTSETPDINTPLSEPLNSGNNSNQSDNFGKVIDLEEIRNSRKSGKNQPVDADWEPVESHDGEGTIKSPINNKNHTIEKEPKGENTSSSNVKTDIKSPINDSIKSSKKEPVEEIETTSSSNEKEDIKSPINNKKSGKNQPVEETTENNAGGKDTIKSPVNELKGLEDKTENTSKNNVIDFVTAAKRKEDAKKLTEKRINLTEQGNVINQTAKMKLMEKENAEKLYKTEVLDNIKSINDNTRKHHVTWNEIFGKKGLITLGLLAFMPVISKILGWILDKLGITDGAGGDGGGLWDLLEDPKKRTMTDEDGDEILIRNGTARERIAKTIGKPTIKSALKEDGIVRRLIKGGKYVTKKVGKGAKYVTKKVGKGIKYVGDKIVDTGMERLIKLSDTKPAKFVKKNAKKVALGIRDAIPHSTKSHAAGALLLGDQYVQKTKSGVKKVTGKITSVMDDIGQADSFIGYLTDLIKKFFNNSKIVKKIGQSAAGQAASQICKSISSTLSKSVLARYAGKIGTAITKAVAKGTGSAVSLGMVDVGFAAWDLTTGAFEAANLFMVSSDQVDAKMRLISSVVKALFGFSFIGPLIDLAAEMFEEVTGVTLKTNIASIIYKLIASQEKADLLNAKQADFKAEWEAFTKTPGNSNVSLTAYNDHKNRTVFQKFIGDPIAKLTGFDDKSVRKNTGIGPTAKITGANRTASVIGKTTSMLTLGLVKADKAGKFVNKIFDKVLGRNQDISSLPKNLQDIEKYNTIEGATEQERTVAAYNYFNNLMDSLQATYGVNSWEEIPQDVLVANGLEQVLEGEIPNVINEMFGINGFAEEGVKYVINEDGSVTKHRIEDIPDIGEYTIDKNGNIESKALKEAKKKNSLGGKIKSAIGKAIDKTKKFGSKLWNGTKEFGSDLWDGTKKITSKAWNGTKKAASKLWKGSKKAWNEGKEIASEVWDKTKKVSSDVWDGTKKITSKAWNEGKEIASDIWDKTKKVGSEVWDDTKKITSKAWNGTKKAASKAWDGGKKVASNVKDGAIKFGNWAGKQGKKIGKTANKLYKNSHIGGFLDSETVRQNLDLNEDVSLTFQDRVSSSLGNVAEIISGGKIDSSDAAHTINGSITIITDKATEVWDNIRDGFSDFCDDAKKNFKKGLNKTNKFLGKILGFTDDNGNPVSLTDGVKDAISEAEKNITKFTNDLRTNASKWWDDTKTGFNDFCDDAKKNFEKGLDKTNKFLGNMLGFTDDNGNPLSLTDGVKHSISEAEKNIIKFATDFRSNASQWWDDTKTGFSDFCDDAKKNFEKGLDKTNKFLGNMLGFTDDNGNPLSLTDGVKHEISEAEKNITNFVVNFRSNASQWWDDTKTGFSDFCDDAKKNFEKGLDKTNNFLGNMLGFTDNSGNPLSLTDGVKHEISEAEKNIIKFSVDFRNSSAKWWKDTKQDFNDWCDDTTKNIKSGIEKVDKKLGAIMGFTDDNGNPISLTEGVNQGIDNATKNISSWASSVKKLGAKLWKNVHDEVDKGVKAVTDVVKKIPGAIDTFIGTLIFGKDDNGNKQKLTTVLSDFFDTAKKTSKKSSDARNKNSGKGGFGTLNAGKGIDSIRDIVREGDFGGKGSDDIGVNDKVNNFAYYSQADTKWANKSYSLSNGTKTKNDSMAARACGPTSMAMVVSHLKGKNFTPTELADFSTKNGYSVENGTTWGMFNRASKKYGIDSKTFNSKSSSGIKSELRKGRPVILAGRSDEANDPNSPFTKGGHFVVAVGASGDKVLINDPRGKNKSKAYDIRKVAKESGQGWSFANNTDKKSSPKTKGNILNRAITGAGNLSRNITNKLFRNSTVNNTMVQNSTNTSNINNSNHVGAGELTRNINTEAFKNTAINYGLETPVINNKTNILNRVITGAGELTRNITNRVFKNTIVNNNVGAGEGSENILNNVYKNTTINYGLGGDSNNKLRKTYLGLGPEKTLAEKIVDTARTAIGMWYVWGGSSPSQGGLDCSGLCQWAYKQNGVSIPRVTYDQIKKGKKITKKEDLKPGDLIFSNFSKPGVPEHVV